MVDASRPATYPVRSSNPSDPPAPTAGPDPGPSSHSITTSSHSRSRSPRSSSRDTSDSDLDRDFDRENNLELHQIPTQRNDDSTASISSGEYRVTTRRTVSRTSQRSRSPRKGVLGNIQRFWTRNVVLTVAQKKNRDYFALERTFLAYIRTSVILAMQGVLIAQLFRLQSPHTSKGLGFHRVGVPLSVTCHCAAMVTAVLGAHRFWKQQSAIALGTIYSGGWELNCIGFLTTAVSFIN
ncbi:DUF202 domain-containing protein [Aspergillus puulaauensis]|uniref:DUF202 domain-containing protein n=1 Tax=Aspergillus puulaauensis TaxID=1220207 RepID=A0A7R8AL14_9EURO|nr:uncharacterized protein APUU_21622A [Aspergillus puulaauensis]BCS21190.1 hypothetical protein APUU_21622A [Aspergillus puulaauensis]